MFHVARRSSKVELQISDFRFQTLDFRPSTLDRFFGTVPHAPYGALGDA
jgi:hypothetical protein